jgi:hypothetical protein
MNFFWKGPEHTPTCFSKIMRTMLAPPNTYPLSRRMLVASLPGIRRASGPVPVTADVGKNRIAHPATAV